jgi:hypothetical protein
MGPVLVLRLYTEAWSRRAQWIRLQPCSHDCHGAAEFSDHERALQSPAPDPITPWSPLMPTQHCLPLVPMRHLLSLA